MIEKLPRREREIFEILCASGEASAWQIRAKMLEAPSHSAVRTMLGRLERRGLIRHRTADQAYIYSVVPRASQIQKTAVHRFVQTFFGGSAAKAATALLGESKKLTEAEIEDIQRAIDGARKRR